VDFLSGIALRARRGVVASTAAVSRRGGGRAPAAPEPPLDPATCASAADGGPAFGCRIRGLLDHPEPKIVHTEVAPAAPSPEVSSPGLQPGEAPSPLAGRAALTLQSYMI